MTLRDNQRITLELDQARLSRAVSAFLSQLDTRVSHVVVRKIAFDVVAETQKGLNGALGGLPKRIDTGRLRGGWRVAMQNGGLRTRGLSPTVPENEAGDGAVVESGRGLTRSVEVSNNVEYAEHVEYGTESMAPGLHLTRALRVVAQQVPTDGQPESLRAEIEAAWTRG